MKGKYTRDMHIYITQDLWDYISESSDKEDLSVNQYIRRLINEDRLKAEAINTAIDE